MFTNIILIIIAIAVLVLLVFCGFCHIIVDTGIGFRCTCGFDCHRVYAF